MSHAHTGDPVTLGVCIGFAMEADQRFGRLVAIRKGPMLEIERYVIREYVAGDGEFPTGGYRTSSRMFLIPHYIGEGTCAESTIIHHSLFQPAERPLR